MTETKIIDHRACLVDEDYDDGEDGQMPRQVIGNSTDVTERDIKTVEREAQMFGSTLIHIGRTRAFLRAFVAVLKHVEAGIWPGSQIKITSGYSTDERVVKHFRFQRFKDDGSPEFEEVEYRNYHWQPKAKL